MRKILSVLFLASLLFQPTQKAEAGVAIYAVSAAMPAKKPGDILASGSGMILGATTTVLGTVAGGIVSIFSPSVGLKIIYASIILDVDGSLKQEDLEVILHEKYHFVDNQKVLSNLSGAIKAKYDLIKGDAYITLSEFETRSILEPSDLSESEILQMVNDLK